MTANSKRKEALVALGLHLKNYTSSDPNYTKLQTCVDWAQAANGWFTKESIEETIHNWGATLNEQDITQWSKPYNFSFQSQKNILLILAGNIPMVGFHDIISVWLSGHNALVKCASKDEHLLPYMTRFLEVHTAETAFTFVDKPTNHFDAVIATGSNNSARYFEYYFGNYPHIIRKNRNGVAVLSGNETKKEMESLGKDILQYFGIGCRNVSKVYLPEGYDLNTLFGGIYPLAKVIEHAKYANNYDYNKAVFIMSEQDFQDNGFFLLKKDTRFSAPIACLHYQFYKKETEMIKELQQNKESIQCIVSSLKIPNALPFGTAQKPALWDHADGKDTLLFLSKL